MENSAINVFQNRYFQRTDPTLLDSIADRMAAAIPKPISPTKLVVTIPAHNEASALPKCLESLSDQLTIFDNKVAKNSFSVIVLCHNCTDNSKQVCSNFMASNLDYELTVLETDSPEVNNVGAVRRILLRIARSRISSEDSYIAMTDADTIVDNRWVSSFLGYVGSGYGLICGRINYNVSEVSEGISTVLRLKRHYEQLRIRLENLIHPDYFEPALRHLDNSGPNMAVRADVHDAVGGLDPIGFCEDVAFYDSIVKYGFEVRHCPLAIVTTSCRTGPRAPWGFGAELGEWSNSEADFPRVEGVGALSERYTINRITCNYFRNRQEKAFQSLIERTGIDTDVLRKYFDGYTSARAVCLCIEKNLDTLASWRLRFPMKSISLVCWELDAYLGESTSDFRQTCKR